MLYLVIVKAARKKNATRALQRPVRITVVCVCY